VNIGFIIKYAKKGPMTFISTFIGKNNNLPYVSYPIKLKTELRNIYEAKN
jgi:hypothetical protein